MATHFMQVLLSTLFSSKDLATEIFQGQLFGFSLAVSGQTDLYGDSRYFIIRISFLSTRLLAINTWYVQET